jgi:hypothetical protein
MLLVRKKGHQPEGKTGLTKRCEKNEVQPYAVAATRSVASRKHDAQTARVCNFTSY